ncbi:MAG TPA: 2-polyprenyl-3-methyl-6-methoxy-1,4-benzoquinone monooxygenase [Acidiferrobacteraceae bacterium]|nr:2-polyprenyl-3-methyl-6-methoxy-1,4-benzoquinone monooxygenase [Acidiferrobacteraceae bacterium]
MTTRKLTATDHFIMGLDQALNTVFGKPDVTERDDPAAGINNDELTEAERVLSGRLMRINHVGEVAAQALYQGQALTAKLPEVREKMERAAQEENDHLAWCESRIDDLDTHKSVLNPLWFVGSFAIGSLAGLAGDRWSLGFVAETEHQVVSHLGGHLQRLPQADHKSRAVLEQMREDEDRHATVALKAGAAELPEPIKRLMVLTSKVMTRTVYWI